MPIKLNLGLSKKIGQPDYGSLGASCHVELELSADLLTQDLDGFHKHVRNAYVACRQAVQDELARHGNASASSNPPQPYHDPVIDNSQINDAYQQRRAQPSTRRSQARPATASQVRAISAIANRQRLDLSVLLHERYHLQTAAELSITEASALIDELKSAAAGTAGGR